MKQFKIFLVTLVALALAMPAFAAVNVKMKGDFQNYFQYSNNSQFYKYPAPEYDDDGQFIGGGTSKKNNDSDFRYNARVRLTWVAEDDEKKVRGTLGTEFDITAGDGRGTATRNGPGGDFEGDNTNFELRWAYLDFEMPFDPATRVYMGLMPAGMNDWIFCDNAMGVRLERGFGDWEAAIGWFRNDTDDARGRGGDDKDEYADLVTLDVTYNFNKGNSLSAFGYYMYDGKTFNGSYSNDSLDLLPFLTGERNSVQVYWAGLAGEFEVGDFFVNATGAYQGGKAKSAAADESGKDADIKAWMAHAEAGVKVDKFTFTLGGLYMSGDDKDDSDAKTFWGIDTDNTMIGSVVLFEFWDATGDYAFYGPQIGQYGARHLYAHAAYDINDKTDVRFGALWLQADEKFEGERNLGYELNAELNYKITKNLVAGIAGGYLIGDDAWDKLAVDGDGDDLWKVISRFRYRF